MKLRQYRTFTITMRSVGIAFLLKGFYMKIKRILNNSVVIARDDDDNEVVVMSKGIGFSKKVGDVFRKQDAEKIFVLSDEVSERYKKLIRNVDPLAAEISETLISYAVDEKKLSLGDLIHITLTDHIDGAIARLKNGVNITNQLTMEIQRVYKDEFEIGQRALALIKSKTGLEPKIDEASFIALHFVNNRCNLCENEDVKETLGFVNDTITIVEKYFNITLKEDSMSYYRFVTHLKFLRKRICGDKVFNDDPMLFETVSKSYANSAKCA